MINVRLKTLLAVEKEKSITKAAEKLNLTQPAVSQHIKSLENELNVKLFVRGENGLKLTDDGAIVVKYAQRMDVLSRNLLIALADRKKNRRHFTVGVTQTAETSAIAEVLAILSAKNDDVRITIISDNIKNLYNKLKIYEVDLIIIEGKISDPNFNSILLDTDYLALAVAESNPLARKSIVTLEELKKQKLILRTQDAGTRELFEATLNSNRETLDAFNVILEVDNIATIKDLVKNDFGVSILARSACSYEIRKGKFRLIPVENLSMTREINIVYHKDFDNTEFLNDIIAIYNKSVKEKNKEI